MIRMLQGNLLCFLFLAALLMLAHHHRIHLVGPAKAPPPIAYTFGYGSLLSRSSVAQTHCSIRNPTDEEILRCPAATGFRVVRVVAGLKRGWYASGVGQNSASNEISRAGGRLWEKQQLFLSPQYLGLVRSDGEYTVNGVVIPISSEAQLDRQDKREAGYDRVEIPWDAVTFLDRPAVFQRPMDKSLPLYAYVVKNGLETLPRPASPIIQSYVDVFVSGALDLDSWVEFLEHNYSFTAEALQTTYDWGSDWINDRTMPFRPHAHFPGAADVDQALLRYVPHQHLQAIRLPGSQ